LQNKYDDLANLYRDKSKKCAQSQQLYDALKKKFMLRGVETAASENVTQTIQSIASQARPETFQGQPTINSLHVAGQHLRDTNDDHIQPDLLGNDLRPLNYRSQRSSDVARDHSMAAPPRPVANRNGITPSRKP
jgi:E3 ubiquitin-protein ligase CCNP1IP1